MSEETARGRWFAQMGAHFPDTTEPQELVHLPYTRMLKRMSP